MIHMRVKQALIAYGIVILMTACAIPAESSGSSSVRAVALVVGSAVTSEDLEREMARLRHRETMSRDRNTEVELRRQAMDGLIDRELLWQESRRQGIVAGENEIAAEMEEFRKTVESSLELDRALQEMKLSSEALRREVERRLSVTAMLERRIASKGEPPEGGIRGYYDRNPALFCVPEKVRISHILVNFDPRWQSEKKEAARKIIETVNDRLRSGDKFAGLATEYSDCPTAAKGGDLGWFGRGSLSPRMETKILSLPPFVASEILEDRYGFHIVMVTGRKPARIVPFSEARPKIVRFLREQKIREEGLSLARELRKGARVEVMDGGLQWSVLR